jgi:hypothetical protein
MEGNKRGLIENCYPNFSFNISIRSWMPKISNKIAVCQYSPVQQITHACGHAKWMSSAQPPIPSSSRSRKRCCSHGTVVVLDIRARCVLKGCPIVFAIDLLEIICFFYETACRWRKPNNHEILSTKYIKVTLSKMRTALLVFVKMIGWTQT